MRTDLTTVPLRALCTNFKSAIVDGPFGSNLKREHYQTNGEPVLKIQNVKEFSLNTKSLDFVSAHKARELSRHSFKSGDIVMTKLGDPLGVSAIVKEFESGIIVADLVRIRADKVDTKFLCYQLNSPKIRQAINAQQQGATRPRVQISMVRDLPIWAPPRCEQQRIVGILDETFAVIATATAIAEKNLANARQLFASTIEEVLQKANGRRTLTLLAAADESCSLSYGIVQPGEELAGGLPIVRPTDLRQKYISLRSLKRIDVSLASSYQRTTLRGDDLLLCVRGTTGTLSIATPELAGGNVTRGIVPIRFNPEILSQELGYFLLLSASAQKQIKAATYGAALMQINIRDLKQVKLLVPPLHQQSALADRLDAAQADIEQLQENYSAKLDALNSLKQSLLHRAFTGELAANVAETIPA